MLVVYCVLGKFEIGAFHTKPGKVSNPSYTFRACLLDGKVAMILNV